MEFFLWDNEAEERVEISNAVVNKGRYYKVLPNNELKFLQRIYNTSLEDANGETIWEDDVIRYNGLRYKIHRHKGKFIMDKLYNEDGTETEMMDLKEMPSLTKEIASQSSRLFSSHDGVFGYLDSFDIHDELDRNIRLNTIKDEKMIDTLMNEHNLSREEVLEKLEIIEKELKEKPLLVK